MNTENLSLQKMVELALKEDLPRGDITTRHLQVHQKIGRAVLKAKQDLIISGQDLFTESMKQMESEAKITWFFKDGQKILRGQNACTIEGNLIQILKAERVALNFLGPLSGIATLTRQFVEEVHHTETKILDTRKTMPLYRDWAKKAVKDGGAENHRRDLSDGIMLKDNHIALIGGIEKAILAVRASVYNESAGTLTKELPIIVEVKDLNEVRIATDLGAERLLLDNMSNEMMAAALVINSSRSQTEASGNMSLDRVRSVAEVGVNFISVGALTHSAPVADFSLLFDWT